MPRRTKTTKQLAELLGVSARSIKGWGVQGVPHTCPGAPKSNLYNVEEVKAWLSARGMVPGRDGRPKKMAQLLGSAGAAPGDTTKVPPLSDTPPRASDSVLDLQRKEALAVARDKHWKAKISKLKALQAESQLVSIEEYTRAHVQRVERAKHRLLRLAASLAPRIVNLSDARAVESAIDTDVREALKELSDDA